MLEESPNFVGSEADSPSFLGAGPATFLGPTDIKPSLDFSRHNGRLPACAFALDSHSGRGNASASMLEEAELPAPGLSHCLRHGAGQTRDPLLVLGLILACKETLRTRREAKQTEIARPKCSIVAKMVSKY